MIIRVFSEGQYEVGDGQLGRLQELDRECQAAVEAGDESEFHDCYTQLLDFLRKQGSELADDDLRGSDLMLPPPDISLAEAQAEFSDHGLIPD